jgi:CRISPR/Cas system-associated exonuclease Cas4 (RecB family)
MSNTKKTIEKAHAKYSPSSSSRWLNCAASVSLSEKIPPRPEGEAAKEGTLAHAYAEALLLTKKPPTAPAHIKKDMIIFSDYVATTLTQDAHDELLVETKVKLPFIHDDLSGTIDVGLVKHYDTLHAIDLKYGRGYVDHVKNTQLIIYTLGLAHLYNFDFADYKATIYQPRSSGDAVRSYEYTNKTLKAYIPIIKKAIDLAEGRNPKATAGEWCKYCPAKAICREVRKVTLSNAALDFDTEVQPEPKDLSLEQLSKLIAKAEYLELWIKDVKAYAEELIKSGKKINGVTMIPTRPTTKWQDEEKLKRFIEKNNLNNVMYASELLSPAEARKVLSKKLSDKTLKKFLSTFTVAVSSGYKLSSTNQNNSLTDGLE